ncbi:tyrosine-type recombinase/integrase [Amycolatopsis sp. NPDC059021]|uniref:tyrosine-type recombinase/integrase n=1 Tax=Amycolatopsis sp. NPDC059021 TaxID=3346704 RepID=UPI00366EB012
MLFTMPDGSPLHPADVSDEFARLIRLAGLPPITLHGLRHGAATIALAAGVDTKVVQHRLRHSSITVTMDLYTNVLEEVAADAARKLVARIPAAVAAVRQQSRARLGLAGDHSGQSTSGRKASGKHKTPDHRFR